MNLSVLSLTFRPFGPSISGFNWPFIPSQEGIFSLKWLAARQLDSWFKEMANTFKDKLLQLADELAHEAYRLTLKFPKMEMYALGDQLRRAILSVPANIIEGYARGREKEKKRFFDISYASLAEAKYLLRFAYRQGYIEEKKHLELKKKSEEVSKLLWSLLSKIKAAQLTS